MNIVFEFFSWSALLAITLASVPQIVLIFKRKSTKGVSLATYGLLLFGLGFLFIRSLFTVEDLIIQLNFGISVTIILIVNIQFLLYRNKNR